MCKQPLEGNLSGLPSRGASRAKGSGAKQRREELMPPRKRIPALVSWRRHVRAPQKQTLRWEPVQEIVQMIPGNFSRRWESETRNDRTPLKWMTKHSFSGMLGNRAGWASLPPYPKDTGMGDLYINYQHHWLEPSWGTITS